MQCRSDAVPVWWSPVLSTDPEVLQGAHCSTVTTVSTQPQPSCLWQYRHQSCTAAVLLWYRGGPVEVKVCKVWCVTSHSIWLPVLQQPNCSRICPVCCPLPLAKNTDFLILKCLVLMRINIFSNSVIFDQ